MTALPEVPNGPPRLGNLVQGQQSPTGPFEQGEPPKTPQELEQRTGEIEGFLQRPEVIAGLMQFSINALQPRGFGQNQIGAVASAIGAGGEAVNRQLTQQENQEQLETEQAQRERDIAVRERGAAVQERHAAVAEAGLPLQERQLELEAQRVGISRAQLGLQRAQMNQQLEIAKAQLAQALQIHTDTSDGRLLETIFRTVQSQNDAALAMGLEPAPIDPEQIGNLYRHAQALKAEGPKPLSNDQVADAARSPRSLELVEQFIAEGIYAVTPEQRATLEAGRSQIQAAQEAEAARLAEEAQRAAAAPPAAATPAAPSFIDDAGLSAQLGAISRMPDGDTKLQRLFDALPAEPPPASSGAVWRNVGADTTLQRAAIARYGEAVVAERVAAAQAAHTPVDRTPEPDPAFNTFRQRMSQ